MAIRSGKDTYWTATRGIIQSGLVLNLDAAVFDSYPQSGTLWYDLSSSKKNGTLTNGPTFNTTNGGNIIFDGTDDYVAETTVLSDAFWRANWTASFWVNFDTLNTTTGSNDKTLIQHGSSTTRSGLHLSQRNTRIHFGLYGDDLSGVTVISINKWYNVVFTLNNTTRLQQIYLNNSLDTSRTAVGAYNGSGSNTRIGGVVLSFGLCFDGFMSSCTFYNRVLSASEISQNYNAIRQRFGL